jgi:hypothetical protein
MTSLLLLLKLFFLQILPNMTTEQLATLAATYTSTVVYVAHAHHNYIEQRYIEKKLDLEKKLKAIADDKRYEKQTLFLKNLLADLTKGYNRNSTIVGVAYLTAILGVALPAWAIILHRGYRWCFPTAQERERIGKENEIAKKIVEKYESEEALRKCLLDYNGGALDEDEMPISCEKIIKNFIAKSGIDEYQKKRVTFRLIRKFAR